MGGHTNHALMVTAAVRGTRSIPGVSESVVNSWVRCISQHALCPQEPLAPKFIDKKDLASRRKSEKPLYASACLEMELLVREIEAPVGVMLTDSEGVILGYKGSSVFDPIARRAGLCAGSVWSEASQGTNGMGTCLVSKEPLAIRPKEHFLQRNTILSCFAAPLHDGTGVIKGVINLSGPSTLSQAPMMTLIRHAARNIEHRALLKQHSHDYVLLFHPHSSFVLSSHSGLVAFDANGTITGINQAALKFLRKRDVRFDTSIEELLQVQLDKLDQLTRHGLTAQLLPEISAFALVQCPSRSKYIGINSETSREVGILERAEVLALVQILEECNWNISRASQRLGMSRRTLHRKVRRYALDKGNTSPQDCQ